MVCAHFTDENDAHVEYMKIKNFYGNHMYGC